MARKLLLDWAPEDTAAVLHAQYRAEAVAEVRTRLHALWLLRRGETPTAVAAMVGVERSSVQRWLRWYRESGLAAVRSGQALFPDAGPGAAGGDGGGHGSVCHGAGGAGLDRGPVWGGLYRGQHVHAAAAAGDPAEGAPAPAHAGGSPGPDGLEKGGLGVRLKAVGLKAGQGIVWGDEMRLGLRGQVRRVWAPRGVAVAQEVQIGWSYTNPV